MKHHAIPRIALILIASAMLCSAQEQPSERHLDEIAVGIPSRYSAMCQKLGQPQFVVHHRYVSAPAWAPDLQSLFENSEEVVLGGLRLITRGRMAEGVEDVSPSGDDAITYHEAKVLRVWKGKHKPGDLVTFATPEGSIPCGHVTTSSLLYNIDGRLTVLPVPDNNVSWGLVTEIDGSSDGGNGAKNDRADMYRLVILFLRRSNNSERVLTPELRLAGGDGAQGMYFAPTKQRDCVCASFVSTNFVRCGKDVGAERIAKCTAELANENSAVWGYFAVDPVQKRYGGIAVAEFLKDLDSLASR